MLYFSPFIWTCKQKHTHNTLKHTYTPKHTLHTLSYIHTQSLLYFKMIKPWFSCNRVSSFTRCNCNFRWFLPNSEHTYTHTHTLQPQAHRELERERERDIWLTLIPHRHNCKRLFRTEIGFVWWCNVMIELYLLPSRTHFFQLSKIELRMKQTI